MNRLDRFGKRLFGLLRVLAWISGVAGLVIAYNAGFTAAWPWLRASALCALPVVAPHIAAHLFARRRRVAP